MVHETIATEKKHQKHLTGRARAVAQAMDSGASPSARCQASTSIVPSASTGIQMISAPSRSSAVTVSKLA
jgi:hypothetical protein